MSVHPATQGRSCRGYLSQEVKLMIEKNQNGCDTQSQQECDGILVALTNEGNTVQICANRPEEFFHTINTTAISWVNFCVDSIEDDGLRIASLFGFSTNLYHSLLTQEYSAYEDRETELGLKLPAIHIDGEKIKILPVLILIKKGLILTLHTEKIIRFFRFGRYADIFFKKIPKNASLEDKITIIITRLLDENNTRNFEYLVKIEMQAEKIHDMMATLEKPGMWMAREIQKVKRMLNTYIYALWATLDVLTTLRYGDADLITDAPKLLGKITILIDDVNRQMELTEQMSEVLCSGHEVVVAIYSNQLQQLNNRITWIAAWLAILSTAAIVPNTIATILGNPLWGFEPSNHWHVFVYLCLLTIPALWAIFGVYAWVKQFAKLPTKKEEAEAYYHGTL